MSLLSKLRSAKGAKHYRKRLGRGRGSGLGQTSGKGNKGQLARSGGKVRRGFEGGQSPLIRRVPKFGFNNKDFETKYSVINLSDLNNFKGEVNPEILKKAGKLKRKLMKVLGNGEIKIALTVRAHKFSEKAKAAIEKAGGKAEVIK
jgi:large subunit ribosomal protein L15